MIKCLLKTSVQKGLVRFVTQIRPGSAKLKTPVKVSRVNGVVQSLAIPKGTAW